MNVLQTPFASIAVCVAVAAATILAKGSLWYLGAIYWVVLGLLALVHIIVTVAVFIANPGGLPVRLSVVFLLLVGQWWAIQMIVMQIIWRWRGFAP